jgi:hypothetical protein
MTNLETKSSIRTSIAAALMVALVGCSSPEAPRSATPSPAANPAPAPPPPSSVAGYPEVPAATGEHANKITDLQNDIQNLTSGANGAAKDFADDLESLLESSETRPRRATLDALGRELATVLPKATNPEVLRPRLAELLFVATRNTPLSKERMTTLQGDVDKLLADHAVPAARAKAIADHVSTIARQSRPA